MKRALAGWLALVLAVSCGSAFALSAGGGKAKKHKNNNGKNDDEPDPKAADKAPWVKPALPAPEGVIQLSTYVFDSVRDDLGLNDDQKTKIEAAKKDICDKGEALAKEQADARTAYDAAKKEKDAEAAMERVLAAASACKHFSPQTEFNQSLSKILTSDQFAKYVELINKR